MRENLLYGKPDATEEELHAAARAAYAHDFIQALPDGGTPQQREAYAEFVAGQRSWLDDYALFMALCEANDWRDWCDWAPALASRQPQALAAARAEVGARIHFWQFCQWAFFRQWLALKAYANEQGVQIVGDAPIFIAHQSAEVWAHQALFELGPDGRPTVVAGVPPDFFSETGQRWGNPLYRWSEHARDGYAWWVERVRRTFELVDYVRIDHFRGFAGYWEIPASEATAVNGRWIDGRGDVPHRPRHGRQEHDLLSDPVCPRPLPGALVPVVAHVGEAREARQDQPVLEIGEHVGRVGEKEQPGDPKGDEVPGHPLVFAIKANGVEGKDQRQPREKQPTALHSINC